MKISIFILLMKMKTKSPAILGAIFAAIILLFPDALHAQQQTGVSVTAGKEFYITGFSGYHDPKFELKVVVEKKCNITAKYNAMGINQYWRGWHNTPVDPGTYTDEMPFNFIVRPKASGNNSGDSYNTLTITADEDITVYAINYERYSTDATTVLPVTAWGKEYRLATIDNNMPCYAVVAKDDYTTVTLHDNATITLHKNQAYHHYDPYNLTGKKVSADKPIAVFSGNPDGSINTHYTCISQLPGSTTTDHCYEQLWSTDKWGKDFFVWPVRTPQGHANWGGIMALVANEDGTDITITGGATGSYQLQAGEKKYVCSEMLGLCRVQSNNPIMVFTVLPDPAITYIPPVDQRILRATLSPFILKITSNIKNHAVEMLIPAAYWDQTVIKEENNVVVNKSGYIITPSLDFPQWYTVRKELPDSEIKIEVSCPGGLLAYMYGYGDAETYGYLAGAGAYDLRNYFTIQERETTVDTYYENTTETTHTFKSGDNITVKRTVETPFTGTIKWLINNREYASTSEGASTLHTFTFPASELAPGENVLTMAVRFQQTTADSLYNGSIWLEQPLVSLGDAPASYDTAAHYLTNRLYLGSLWDVAKVQSDLAPSINANTAGNDDALTLTTTDGYTDLTQTGLTLNATGKLTSTFNLTNSTGQSAKLRGWIDFNRNGKFDAGEASDEVTVTPGVNTPKTLTWNNASSMIRHGITYMRLRLSTEALSSPTDTIGNGEVEDYMLNLKLLDISKTSVSNNLGSTDRAALGDTLTYSITVTNPTSAALSNVTVFDPLPLHTTYVAGSASGSGTLVDNMAVYGNMVKAIKWNQFASWAAGASETFTFKAAVTDLPQLHNADDSTIINIAYAVMNDDTIPSTGNNCNVALITADLLNAVDDAAAVNSGIPVVVDILANDNLGKCDQTTILVEILVPPKSGNLAEIDPTDKTLRYTADASFSGKDSLTYKITCRSTVSTAKVRFTVAAMLPVAIDDRAYVFACSSTSLIDVLANDANVASGTVTRVHNGHYGAADIFPPGIGGTQFMYDQSHQDCAEHGGKTDTARYRVCTASGCAEANILIHILRIPRIVVADSCSQKPYLQSNLQYKGATYQWYKSSDGNSSWTPIPSETNAQLYVTEDAWYKLEVTYRNINTETPKIHFVVRKKYRLPNGNYWYDTMTE